MANPTIKFVTPDPARGGLPTKRKQVAAACSPCRRRKKRCTHTAHKPPEEPRRRSLTTPFEQIVTFAPLDPHPHDAAAAAAATPTTTTTTTLVEHRPQPATPIGPDPRSRSSQRSSSSADRTPSALFNASSRFIGDSNPEGMFVEATDHETESGRHRRQQNQSMVAGNNGELGVWSSTGPAATSSVMTTAMPTSLSLSSANNNNSSNNNNNNNNFSGLIPGSSHAIPLLERLLLPVVREQCLACIPPRRDYEYLRQAFVQKIHPIFPVLPLHILSDVNDGSPTSVLVRQLVCIAAAADPAMSAYLCLESNGSTALLSSQDFSHLLTGSIRALLETSLINDRLVRIRAYLFLSLYLQPSTSAEADLPAQLGGRAVHELHTLGLQIVRYGDGEGNDELQDVLCAVWAMDRVNGAVYGRPLLMHERDFGADIGACIRRRSPCFRLFLLVVQWLDKVIALYRPGPTETGTTVAMIDLPVLETLIVEADALKVPSSLISTIETFYHGVIILSCRLPRPGTPLATSMIPPASANARRSLAAERIASSVAQDRPSPVPLVPYAVSLALSVEYRKMRHSQLPMFRTRAQAAFRSHCDLLRSFAGFYWNARVVAGLGERVLAEMERAAGSMADSGPFLVVGGRPAAHTKPAAKTTNTNGNHNHNTTTNHYPDSRGCASTTSSSAPSAPSSRAASTAAIPAETRAGAPPPPPPPTTTAVSTAVPEQPPSTAAPPAAVPAPQPPPSSGIDVSAAAAAGEWTWTSSGAGNLLAHAGVFDHFDPNFDLVAADNAMESNLDIGLSLQWIDWDALAM